MTSWIGKKGMYEPINYMFFKEKMESWELVESENLLYLFVKSSEVSAKIFERKDCEKISIQGHFGLQKWHFTAFRLASYHCFWFFFENIQKLAQHLRVFEPPHTYFFSAYVELKLSPCFYDVILKLFFTYPEKLLKWVLLEYIKWIF